MNFLGYERPDGSVGARNYVLVIPSLLSGLVASKICEFVDGTRTIVIASGNFEGHTNHDRAVADRALIGLGLNPNVASVIVDNEYRSVLPLSEEIAKSGKRVETLDPATDGGTFGTIEKGIQLAREMVQEASQMRRQEFDMGKLTLAVKCGGSDATSGIAGNPVVGHVFDRIIDAGGTAIFGENTEIVGAEHVLAKRAVSDEVAQRILKAADDIDAALIEFEAYRSGHVFLRLIDRRLQHLALGCKPITVIYHLGVTRDERVAQMDNLTIQGQRLYSPMRNRQNCPARCFIHPA